MTLKLFLLAVLFVISGGAAFSEYFKGRKMLSFLATAVAIIATFYLFQDIYDDLKQWSSSPQPYIDIGNGTVTDNRTGLIWLKNADTFGIQKWNKARERAANLESGQYGLRDGSKRGMWRLPSIKEWEAMVDKDYMEPALSNATDTGRWEEGDAFLNVHKYSDYWSSTSGADKKNDAWYMDIRYGSVGSSDQSNRYYVWPVRDEHWRETLIHWVF